MFYPLRRIWQPALYQGGSARKRYFEGWYFKSVDADGAHPLSIIPGVSFSEDGSKAHAFVQLVRPGGTSRYFAFPPEAFAFRKDAFGVSVGANTFSAGGMHIELRDPAGEVRGDVGFGQWTPWPVTLISPGVMGPYRFVPRMECYHGVLSFDHALTGGLTVDGQEISLEGGRGYVEKDWGRSFPSSWVWAQSNHFGRPGISVSASVARVPWMSGAFTGHVAGLLLDGALHRFTTYTGAKLACMATRPGSADMVFRDARRELELHVEGADPAPLKAPVLGAMEARADETLGATVHATLRVVRGGLAERVFDGEGHHAGVEIMNHLGELEDEPCDELPRSR